MSDERKHLPSASGMERIDLCPGSFLLEQCAPEPPPSEWAESGRRIHAALAGKMPVAELTEDERDRHDACAEAAAKVCQDVLGCKFEDCDELVMDSERLWLTDPNTLEPRMSGLPDVVARKASNFLVLDYKSFYGDVAPAKTNWQLRSLAALVGENYASFRIEHPTVYVAIIRPWLDWKVAVCAYDEGDIAAATMMVRDRAFAAVRPNQPRTPGEKQCGLCRAKLICPEATAVLGKVEKLTHLPVSNDKLAEWLDLFKIAEKVIKAGREEAENRLRFNPDCIPGWKLERSAPRHPITNFTLLRQRAAERYSIAEAELLKCVSTGKEALKDLLKLRTGLKGKALDAAFDTLTEGTTEIKQGEPSLKRIKE